MRNDLLYCQSSIVKNAPPPPNMVAKPRLLQPKFEDLIVIKTNISCIGCEYSRAVKPTFCNVTRGL